MNEPVAIVQHRAEREETQAIELGGARVSPLSTDLWIYRVAIIVLGALALIALGGALMLAAVGHDAPQVSVALGSAAVGALAGLMSPTPARS